jgi:hypothetical protein
MEQPKQPTRLRPTSSSRCMTSPPPPRTHQHPRSLCLCPLPNQSAPRLQPHLNECLLYVLHVSLTLRRPWRDTRYGTLRPSAMGRCRIDRAVTDIYSPIQLVIPRSEDMAGGHTMICLVSALRSFNCLSLALFPSPHKPASFDCQPGALGFPPAPFILRPFPEFLVSAACTAPSARLTRPNQTREF